MKKETQAKRDLKKFEAAPTAIANDLLDDFADELDAMRGEDSEPEDGGLIGSRIGVAVPYGQDEILEE